jgi:mRNA-degrading endonuclease toxin of MazEF toxin-antitoxin module
MRSGDVYQVDFGSPLGSEARFVRPAVVITDDDILESIAATSHHDHFVAGCRRAPRGRWSRKTTCPARSPVRRSRHVLKRR